MTSGASQPGDPALRPDPRQPAPRSIAPAREPRKRLRLVVLVLAILAGPVVAEIWVRFLLFHPSRIAKHLGSSWRDPGRFGDPNLDQEYWIMSDLLGLTHMDSAPPGPDPLLGWTGRRIEPGTYQLRNAGPDDGRRPVLLYGASYASCVIDEEDCFHELMERSDLASRYCLFNYGVGGYGIDQIYLLLRETIDDYAGRNPIVAIAAVVDSDFERCVLGIRDWPKPRLHSVDGELVQSGPVIESRDAYLREHGSGIVSYACLAAQDRSPIQWCPSA